MLTYGDLTVDHASVSAAGLAPVPLPAGALMLGAALGGLGVMARRRAPTAG